MEEFYGTILPLRTLINSHEGYREGVQQFNSKKEGGRDILQKEKTLLLTAFKQSFLHLFESNDKKIQEKILVQTVNGE